MAGLYAALSILLTLTPMVADAADTKTPEVIVDIVQFRGEGARTRWEFQYTFPDTALRYVAGKEGFEADLLCSLEVISEVGDTTRDEWIASASSQTAYVVHQRYYSGIRSFMLTPGTYKVNFSAIDVHDKGNSLRTSFTSSVRSFSYSVASSDIMFVAPTSAGADERFTRSGQAAVPNPRHEIIGADPSICFYIELYNAKREKLDTFALEVSVLDNVREEVITSYMPMVGFSDGIVVREELPAGALRSGVYTLRLRFRSRDLEKDYATQEERFFVLNPELPPEGRIYLTETEQFLSSEWAVTTGERLEHELELSDVLATNAEKTVRLQCTDERCKQRYLYRFWRDRDPDGSTVVNERLEEFRKMYQRAQTFYSSPSFRNGWKSDRGIILLRYGIPTQVTQYIQTIDTKPYEEWFYQGIQGGVYFYFVDWQLQQNHRLVHSTMMGQVREPNWFNLYAKAFDPNPNPIQSLQNNKR